MDSKNHIDPHRLELTDNRASIVSRLNESSRKSAIRMYERLGAERLCSVSVAVEGDDLLRVRLPPDHVHVSHETITLLPVEERIQLTVDLLAILQQFLTTRVAPFVPDFEIFSHKSRYFILLCPGPAQGAPALDSEHYQSQINAITARVRTRLTTWWQDSDTVVAALNGIDLSSLVPLDALFVQLREMHSQFHHILPPMAWGVTDETGWLYRAWLLKERQAELAYYLGFFDQIRDGKTGVIRLIGQDLNEINDIFINYLKPALGALGLATQEADDIDNLPVELETSDTRKVIVLREHPDRPYEPSRCVRLLQDQDIAAVVIFSPVRSHINDQHFIEFSLRQPNSLYQVVEFFPLSPDQVSQLVKDWLRRSDAKTLQLASRLYELTGGSYTELRLAVEFLKTGGELRWNAARQFYDVLVDIAALPADTVYNTLHFEQAELLVLQVLSCAISPVTQEKLRTVARLSAMLLNDSLAPLMRRGFIVDTRDGISFASLRQKTFFNKALLAQQRRVIHERYWHCERDQNASSIEHVWHGVLGGGLPEYRDELLRTLAYALKGRCTGQEVVSVIKEIVASFTHREWISRQTLLIQILNAGARDALARGVSCEIDDLLVIAREHVRDPLHLVDIVIAKIEMTKLLQRFSEAIDTGATYLQLLGVTLPLSPTDTDVLKHYLVTRWALAQRHAFGRSLRMHKSTSLRSVAINAVMGHIAGAAYMHTPKLFPILCCYGVQASLKHGIVSEHAFGYAGFAYCVTVFAHRSAMLGSYDEAERMLRYSTQVQRELQESRYSARIRLIRSGFIRPWTGDTNELLLDLHRGYREGNACGDHEYGLYCAAIAGYLALARGLPLAPLERDIDLPLLQAREINQRSTVSNLAMLLQFIGLVRGDHEQNTVAVDTPDLLGDFDIEVEQGDRTVSFIYCVLRMLLATLVQDWESTRRYAAVARAYADGIQGQQLEVLHLFLETWALLQSPSLGMGDRLTVAANLWRFQRWAAQSPSNYEYLFLALKSCSLRAPNKNDLLQAYATARERANLVIAAMIVERLGLCHAESRDYKKAQQAVEDARELYAAWGALSKAQSLSAARDGAVSVLREQPEAGGRTTTGILQHQSILALSANPGALNPAQMNSRRLALLKALIDIGRNDQVCLLTLRRAKGQVELLNYGNGEDHGAPTVLGLETLDAIRQRIFDLAEGEMQRDFRGPLRHYRALFADEDTRVVIELVNDGRQVSAPNVKSNIATDLLLEQLRLLVHLQEGEQVRERLTQRLQASALELQSSDRKALMTRRLLNTVQNDNEKTLKSLEIMLTLLLRHSEHNPNQEMILESIQSLVNAQMQRITDLREQSDHLACGRPSKRYLLIGEGRMLSEYELQLLEADGHSVQIRSIEQLKTGDIAGWAPDFVVLHLDRLPSVPDEWLARHLPPLAQGARQPRLIGMTGANPSVDGRVAMRLDAVLQAPLNAFKLLGLQQEPELRRGSLRIVNDKLT